jgi:hypothetical protein
MAESLDIVGNELEAGKTGNSKKIYALALVVVILVAAIGFLVLSQYMGIEIFGERIANSGQAADTLSGLGNDLSDISRDLKDMEDNL